GRRKSSPRFSTTSVSSCSGCRSSHSRRTPRPGWTERFLLLLATIHDPRRAEGKLYQLPYVLLFSILAIVSGANSYRGICTFIKVHRRKLNKAFKISWKRPPAHTAIRYILQGLTAADVEKAFREHAANLNFDAAVSGTRV